MSESGRCEYVLTSELAARVQEWLDRHEDEPLQALSDRAGVSPRAINKLLKGERPYQTIWFADRVLLALDSHIFEMRTVFIKPSENKLQEAFSERCE